MKLLEEVYIIKVLKSQIDFETFIFSFIFLLIIHINNIAEYWRKGVGIMNNNLELKLNDRVICFWRGKKHYCKVVQMNFIYYLMDLEDPRIIIEIDEAENMCIF